MARYALIKPDGSIDRFADNIDPNVQTKPGFRWLPFPAGTAPAYDASAEVLVGPTYSVSADGVVETWSKRTLTAQELSDRKDARVPSANDVVLLVAFNHENRIRTLESKPAVTMAQFRAAVKALL